MLLGDKALRTRKFSENNFFHQLDIGIQEKEILFLPPAANENFPFSYFFKILGKKKATFK